MCESTVYLRRGDEEELVLEEVTFVEPAAAGGGYRIRTLFGEERTVAGRLVEFDLLKHRVVFEAE